MTQPTEHYTKIRALLLGLSLADALGVPVEFQSRQSLSQRPVLTMQGFGTYHQEAGTFSDDASLAFCLAETLIEAGPKAEVLGQKALAWYRQAYWSARGTVFDIGIGTRLALERFEKGSKAEEAGGKEEKDNGNGALMRILPLLPAWLRVNDPKQAWDMLCPLAGLTHGHWRSHLACYYYLNFAKELWQGANFQQAYLKTNQDFLAFLALLGPKAQAEQVHFNRILQGQLAQIKEADIRSDGYVIHSLEAAIWVLWQGQDYESVVLKAVNLGGDTDTTACIAGGLAALHRDWAEGFPKAWLELLAKKQEIEDLALRLSQVYA